MKTTITAPFSRQLLAAALAALPLAPLLAAEAAIDDATRRTDLATPENTITLGIGHLSGEHRRYGTYRGADDSGFYGLLDADLNQRDAEGGSLRLRARNLGLDTRRIRVDLERQGDWSVFVDYRGFSRQEPLIALTGLDGAGTDLQTINGSPLRALSLATTRDVSTLGSRYRFGDGYALRLSFRQDERDGERIYGRRSSGNQMQFLAAPTEGTTRQWELGVSKSGERLQYAFAYQGSSFTSPVSRIVVTETPGVTPPASDAFSRITQPLDNDAHQLNLSGAYRFTTDTRSSFKASYEIARQTEALLTDAEVARLAGSPASLDGEVRTARVFADLTTVAAETIDITTHLRYENRSDRTPDALFIDPVAPNAGGTLAGLTGRYIPRHQRRLDGLLEATVRVAEGLSAFGGLEYEAIDRSVPEFRRNAYREKNDETTARLGLRRMLDETLNGSLSVQHSERGGSDYIPDTYAASAGANQLHALVFADRSRDKLRLEASWLLGEDWSLQMLTDVSTDRYSGRAMGPMKGDAQFASLDATYTISFRWTASAWVAFERTRAEQLTRSSATNFWSAAITQKTSAVGFSLRGRPSARLGLQADLGHSIDDAEHDQSLVSGTTPTSTLPDYRYRTTTLRLGGDYALDDRSGLAAELVVDHRRNNDWTWLGWTYVGTDGTTVINPADETAVFAGVRYRYRWR